MQHIADETYKGHELVFIYQDNRLITVDIRSDDFAGEFIQGYSDMLRVHDARLKATGFIDGYEAIKQLQGV